MITTLRVGLIAVLVVLTPCRGAFSQIPDWSSIPASASDQRGLEESLAYVVRGHVVSAFSAISRTWSSVAVQQSPVAVLNNESLIVRDGAIFYGFSPHTGTFAAQLTLSPTATLLTPSSPQTWQSVVVDGNDVHVFFAVSGQWQTYVFASAPAVSIGRFCVLFDDGQSIQAVSSFYGSAVTLTATGASIVGTFGNVGMAISAGQVHGFSAARNLWSSLPIVGTPAFTTGNVQCGFVAINDGYTLAFFSGHTGSFLVTPASPSAAVSLQREVAIIVDGTSVHGYSGLLGSIDTIPVLATPTVQIDQYLAMVDDPAAGLTVFGAETGRFSVPLIGWHQAQTTAFLAVATSPVAGSPSMVYSSLRDQWIAFPPVSSPTVYKSALSVVVDDGMGGLWGYSARGDHWVYEAFGPATVIIGTNPPQTAGTIVAHDGSSLRAFNPRTESWRGVPMLAAPTYIRGHASVILVVDGVQAYAFSNLTDDWSVLPLAAPPVAQGAQVHAAYVHDGNQFHVYSGVAQVSTIGDFPDHWRNVTQGQRFRVDVAGEPGADTYLLASLVAADIPTPWGTLWVDPTAAFIFAHLAMPAAGCFGLTMQVPILPPGISGIPVHFQGVVFGPSGPYLTDAATTIVY